MAHGTPRINVCWNCEHYIQVNRFSLDPICPICNKKTSQTSKDELMKKYWIPLFEFNPSFDKYTKLPSKR